jgi:hypothetical protein
MAEPTVSPFRATQHETLVLKLEALLHEVRPLALRHPEAAVPAPLATLAEGLLFDVRPFTGRRRREAMPAAAPEFSGLVVQLGQALATLAAFEVRHTVWSPKLAAYVWRVGRDHDTPVARLRPRLAQISKEDRRDSEHMRAKVLHLIHAKVADAYERGLAGDSPPFNPLGER